jgi:LysR family glycine cleavage system transcriptional activator
MSYQGNQHMPPIYTLVYFEAVARLGSFTLAADELCVTQSAVSKQIKSLEQNLQFPLFERQQRGVALTKAGKELYESTQPLLNALSDTVARIKRWQVSNVVSVICTQAVSHYWLFPRLVLFNQVRPDITVNIISTNDITAESCLGHDFGVLYGDGQWSGLQACKLFDEVIFPICSNSFQAPEIVSPEQILSLRLVQLDPRAWSWMNWSDWFKHFDVAYHPPENMLVYNQVTLALSASAQGLGVALGWEFMARDSISSGIIKQLGPFAFHTGSADYLVSNAAKPLSPAAEVFKSWVLSTLN